MNNKYNDYGLFEDIIDSKVDTDYITSNSFLSNQVLNSCQIIDHTQKITVEKNQKTVKL